MAYETTLKDTTGTIVYPQTKAQVCHMNDGTSVESAIITERGRITAQIARSQNAQQALQTELRNVDRHTRLTDFDLTKLQSAVVDQNLAKYGLKQGDQKTINGYTYVISGLNEMKGTNGYTCTNDHVGLIVIPHTTQAWNASGNTYTGANNRGAGYAKCDLHYYLVNTVLPHVKNDLGANHLYGHRKIYTTAVNTTGYNRFGTNSGCSSSQAWSDSSSVGGQDQMISALTEMQVYGGTIWSSSGYDTGQANQQLQVFKHFKYTDIFGNEYIWLRDVASASGACFAHYGGYADNNTASLAYCVAALILYH